MAGLSGPDEAPWLKSKQNEFVVFVSKMFKQIDFWKFSCSSRIAILIDTRVIFFDVTTSDDWISRYPGIRYRNLKFSIIGTPMMYNFHEFPHQSGNLSVQKI